MAQKVGRGIALLFHDRGTKRGWVFSSTPRPHFTTGKDLVPILQEAGWAPGPVWTGGKSRHHRDSIPDRPARSQSLYRLSYPAHILYIYTYFPVLLFLNWKLKAIFHGVLHTAPWHLDASRNATVWQQLHCGRLSCYVNVTNYKKIHISKKLFPYSIIAHPHTMCQLHDQSQNVLHASKFCGQGLNESVTFIHNTFLYGVSCPTWPRSAGQAFYWAFIRLYKDYYPCDHLSNSRHWPINLTNMQHVAKCRQSVRRSIGLALISQARGSGKTKHPIDDQCNTRCWQCSVI